VKKKKVNFYQPTKRHKTKLMRLLCTLTDLEGTGIDEEHRDVWIEFDKINKRIIIQSIKESDLENVK
jgi:hypothetical protein